MPKTVTSVSQAISALRRGTVCSVVLNRMKLKSKDVERLAALLRTSTAVILLDLSINEVGDEGVVALAQSLKDNQTLTELNLEANDFTRVGIVELVSCLNNNKVLRKLEIGHNMCNSEGARRMGELLRNNTALTYLGLDGSRLGCDGAQHLAAALCANTTLLSLNLSYCRIEEEGARRLGIALQQNETLTILSLRGNYCSALAAELLAPGLAANKALTYLDLSSCHVSEGAVALANALTVNTALQSLRLDENSIEDPGAEALVEALKENKALTFLTLVNNLITGAAASKFTAILGTENTTLSTLKLERNKIWPLPPVMDPLKQALVRNASPPLVLSVLLTLQEDGKVLASCSTIGGSAAARAELPPNATLAELRSALQAVLDPKLNGGQRNVRFVLPNSSLLHQLPGETLITSLMPS